MTPATSMRRALEVLDIATVRKLWAFLAPHLPPLTSDTAALKAAHMARTGSSAIHERHRIYSHAWLRDRGLPSQLPDHLKQSADRLYPVKVSSVGISVGSRYVEVEQAVRGAMEYAVEDCYAMGDEDPRIVKPEMMRAKDKELKGLGLTRRAK